jgi:hypothetical protein
MDGLLLACMHAWQRMRTSKLPGTHVRYGTTGNANAVCPYILINFMYQLNGTGRYIDERVRKLGLSGYVGRKAVTSQGSLRV